MRPRLLDLFCRGVSIGDADFSDAMTELATDLDLLPQKLPTAALSGEGE